VKKLSRVRIKPKEEAGFLTTWFAPRGELGPGGELCPLGRMFTPLFNPRGEYSLLFRRMEGPTENVTPYGTKFTPGSNFDPGGLPLRASGDSFFP
jgi:hypothetical protein